MNAKILPVLLAVVLWAPGVEAADKTHQQMLADIRMLQEHQQQLQQMIGTLAESVRMLTTRIDEQAGATRKGFADQKLLVDGVAESVRILREKADDTNVRLSTMTQELESMRQSVASAPAGGAATSSSGDPSSSSGSGASTPPPATNVSPQKAYDAAFNDYTGGQYDLAIQGFEFYIKTFPTSPQADDAQLNICNSYYALGQYKDAAAACQRLVTEYAQADTVPQAYYKLGLSYEGLKQPDLARRAYETVIKNYPTAVSDATLAKQRLDALNRRQE